MKKILTVLCILGLSITACKKKTAGGCFRCFCNEYSETTGDGKCDTKRNNSTTKCGHLENEHA